MTNHPPHQSPCYHDILTLLAASPLRKEQIYAGIPGYKPKWIRTCLMKLIEEKKVERLACGEMKNFLYRKKVDNHKVATPPGAEA